MLGDRDMGLALGAADHLTKPIMPQDLFRVLSRVQRSDEATDVLIVDDDEGTRDVLHRTLTREGWSVREAENGAEGLEQLAVSKPAVILLDLMMPQMNGFEMLRTMRENPDWHDVPVVIVTSKDLGRDELEWLRAIRWTSSRKAPTAAPSWSRRSATWSRRRATNGRRRTREATRPSAGDLETVA